MQSQKKTEELWMTGRFVEKNYEIGKFLGGGTFGKVYEAQDKIGKLRFALKVQILKTVEEFD